MSTKQSVQGYYRVSIVILRGGRLLRRRVATFFYKAEAMERVRKLATDLEVMGIRKEARSIDLDYFPHGSGTGSYSTWSYGPDDWTKLREGWNGKEAAV